MIVLEMMKIWAKYNPSYLKEESNDYPACLQIAYKIAILNQWGKQEVLNGKMEIALEQWEGYVQFIIQDSFFLKLSLEMLAKKWQSVVRSYDNKKTVSVKNNQNPNSYI